MNALAPRGLAEVVDIRTRTPSIRTRERRAWETFSYVATQLSPLEAMSFDRGMPSIPITPPLPADAMLLGTSIIEHTAWAIYGLPLALRSHLTSRFSDIEDKSRVEVTFGRGRQGVGYRRVVTGDIERGLAYTRLLIDPQEGLREEMAREVANEIAGQNPEFMPWLQGKRRPRRIFVTVDTSFDRFTMHRKQYVVPYPFP